MKINASTTLLFAAAGIVCMATSPIVFAQDASPSADAVSHALGGKEFSPYVGRNYPTKALWGDQHTHTQRSRSMQGQCAGWARKTPFDLLAGKK